MLPIHRKPLTADNLKTIENALIRVRDVYGFEPGSMEEQHIGAVMVGEFQLGNATEDGLVATLLGEAPTG